MPLSERPQSTIASTVDVDGFFRELVGQAINHIEMVTAGFFDRAGSRAEAGPDVGKQGVLANEFRALPAAHPAGHPGIGQRLQQHR